MHHLRCWEPIVHYLISIHTTMITTQHARRIAIDTYNLASLFLRQVLLTKPMTINAYREKTRELLLMQSRQSIAASQGSNFAAVKLLEWDKKWNLVKYYGIREYGRRWWGSKSNPDSDVKKTAQSAFMITSDQRRELTELGYSSTEIRSFKPIEALLLVRNSVKRNSSSPDYDFKMELRKLVEDNERLGRAEPKACQTVSMKQKDVIKNHAPDFEVKETQMSPQDAERSHVKPDIALALFNADKHENHDDNIVQHSPHEGNKTTDKHCDEVGDNTLLSATNHSLTSPNGEVTSSNPDTIVRPQDSQELNVKPDVAAAYLSARQTKHIKKQSLESLNNAEESTSPSWYEVVEVSSKTHQEQIIALFSSKKEALDCVQIKEVSRKPGNRKEMSKSSHFIIRRRWNVE